MKRHWNNLNLKTLILDLRCKLTHSSLHLFSALLKHVTRWRGAWLDPASSLLRLARAALRGGKCARLNRVVVVGIIRYGPPPALSLALRCDRQARTPAAIDSTCSRGAWLRVPIVIQVVWTHGGVPVMVWPAAKLFKSDWSEELTAHSHSLVWASLSQSLVLTVGCFIMSTTNQIFFEDKSDVPDLLKSLADYPFSLPVFDDTGKSTFF